ncbi:DUF58 domain-containing protein [Luteimonas terricola]|uniref:DUF58 domain-containing protein n=1 Tax=Luteimonas terricola TaxID=645597 RepID=A0ABQ2EE37_9GAMM|nr:DUF58 domain-containing protein [Luteimonas terricola]GGK05293.1 hypothetical protein GCM10011394_13060 [Luteimonas terricola]
MATHGFLPADVRARLRQLALVPRSAIGDRGFGQHASRSRGAGLEFAQYRAYEPGDELRQVDWKLYARSDRYFVREAERDSPLTAWIVVDASASMAQADGARPGWSRLDAARGLAAATIDIALRQGDRFGLAAINGDGLALHTAAAGPRHRDRCLLALGALRTGGGWPSDAALAPLYERVAPRDLVLLLTDGFDAAALRLAERLAAARREVLVIRVLTVEERDFPFEGGHLFRDVEGGAELRGDGAAMRAGFLERFGAARREQSAYLAAAGVRQVEYVLDEALDLPLRRLFADDARGGAAGR